MFNGKDGQGERSAKLGRLSRRAMRAWSCIDFLVSASQIAPGFEASCSSLPHRNRLPSMPSFLKKFTPLLHLLQGRTNPLGFPRSATPVLRTCMSPSKAPPMSGSFRYQRLPQTLQPPGHRRRNQEPRRIRQRKFTKFSNMRS